MAPMEIIGGRAGGGGRVGAGAEVETMGRGCCNCTVTGLMRTGIGVSAFLISRGGSGSAFLISTENQLGLLQLDAGRRSLGLKTWQGDEVAVAFGGSITAGASGGAGAGAGAGTGSDGIGAVVPGGRSGGASDDSRFIMRTLPVWLRVFTGSASAINCSMFLIGSPGPGGRVSLPVAGRVGGRRMTPCTTGMVRVARALTDGAFNTGGGSGCGAGRGT